MTVLPGDTGTVTLTVKTPGANVWTKAKEFDGTGYPDLPVRQRCGKRGLEAELEVVTTAGRPVVRSLHVETTAAGRVKDE